jgi:Na+/H+ antiporter NhaD/arsenite permease-like protein
MIDLVAVEAHVEGAKLGLIWSLPFISLLLSIALLPLVAPHFWERHFGKVAAFWAFAFILPCAFVFGAPLTALQVLDALLLDYLPFIVLLFALFVVAGGIRITGNLVGTPATNVAMLTFGTLGASLLGTTGAAMVLIRPMIQANRNRRYNVHIFVFFIFLVANIGGSLTPLGDPPLFLGFLNGVDFFWSLQAMAGPMLLLSTLLLALFYAIDRIAWAREPAATKEKSRRPRRLQVEGLHNVLCLAAIAGAVLASGLWKGGTIAIGLGIHMPVAGLARDCVLIAISLLSWRTTKASIRVENAFTWAPMQEVATLFAAIFITMIPMLAMLRAGADGALAPLVELVSSPAGERVNSAYFWLTGGLSSLLDNAPTYLVFFNLAGGDAKELMGPLATTLLAISAGAVFMGAFTYIGNAPNFMVRSICVERGIKMPSFIGYMLWSGAILLPLFLLIDWLWFRT